MKAIKNITEKDMEVPFNGFTYFLEKDKAVFVEEDFSEFCQERWPNGFEFNVKVEPKKPIVQAKKTKTKAFIPTSEEAKTLGTDDMKIRNPHVSSTFEGLDLTPPSGTTDKDGVGWYGPGVETDTLT